MRRSGRYMLALAGAAVVAAATFGIVSSSRLSAAPAGDRTFYVTVHEPRGGTTTLAAPTVNPETVSKGYVFYPVGFDPARPTRWDVESYVYAPAMLAAFEGDRVNLKVFVVNADKHDTTVVDPAGRIIPVRVSVEGETAPTTVSAFDTPRGRQTTVSFALARPGMYEVRCVTHAPSMTLHLLALPRR